MKIIKLGEEEKTKKYGFRETCFGICEKNGKILLVKKNGEYSFVGGGIDENETKTDCISREYMEESGYIIVKTEEFCAVDCFWFAAKGTFPMHSLANYFVVDVSNKCVEPLEVGHYPEWVEKCDVLELLQLPYHKEAYKRYLNETRQ